MEQLKQIIEDTEPNEEGNKIIPITKQIRV